MRTTRRSVLNEKNNLEETFARQRIIKSNVLNQPHVEKSDRVTGVR